jgi:hypothetical protein
MPCVFRPVREGIYHGISRNDFKGLVERLASFRLHLKDAHGDSHTFHRTSSIQSDHAYHKFKQNSKLTEAELVAVLFANVEHVRQFQAATFTTSYVIRNLIETIEEAHVRGDLISILGQLRSLLERIAHLHFVTETVSSKLGAAGDSSDARRFLSTFDITDDLRNALYGTTVRSNLIAEKALEEIDLKKDLGKGSKEELGLYWAEQVLNKIDRLNKSAPGVRAAYEILCDYLHPNVGDLFAATSSYVECVDRSGVKHIIRTIGGRPHDLPTADRVALTRVFGLVVHLVEISEYDYQRCKWLDEKLTDMATSYTRQVIKKNRHLFKKRDFCPCSSGELIFRCCGQRLLLGGGRPSR